MEINFVIVGLGPQRGQTACNEIKLNQFFEKNRELTRTEKERLTLFSQSNLIS